MFSTVYTTVRVRPFMKRKVGEVVDGVLIKLKQPGAVSVHLIGDTKMRRLNREYRGKDRTTDVLSFGLEGESIKGEKEWGDIFLSLPQIERQARAFGVPLEQEFIRMLIHGLLHLLGYDHEKEIDAKQMFFLQEKYVAAFI